MNKQNKKNRTPKNQILFAILVASLIVGIIPAWILMRIVINLGGENEAIQLFPFFYLVGVGMVYILFYQIYKSKSRK